MIVRITVRDLRRKVINPSMVVWDWKIITAGSKGLSVLPEQVNQCWCFQRQLHLQRVLLREPVSCVRWNSIKICAQRRGWWLIMEKWVRCRMKQSQLKTWIRILSFHRKYVTCRTNSFSLINCETMNTSNRILLN